MLRKAGEVLRLRDTMEARPDKHKVNVIQSVHDLGVCADVHAHRISTVPIPGFCLLNI